MTRRRAIVVGFGFRSNGMHGRTRHEDHLVRPDQRHRLVRARLRLPCGSHGRSQGPRAERRDLGAAPASVPKSAQAAAIYGDPSKEGLFALRLKLPKGYHIPPHTHPKPELVTVLSGTLRLGEGATADQGKTKPDRGGESPSGRGAIG